MRTSKSKEKSDSSVADSVLAPKMRTPAFVAAVVAVSKTSRKLREFLTSRINFLGDGALVRLIRTVPCRNSLNRSPEYQEVTGHRPIFNVIEIKSDALLPG